MSKILMIGCGGVGKTLLELNCICRFIPFSLCRDIDIIEPEVLEQKEPFYRNYNIHHYRYSLTKRNIRSILGRLIPGKVLVIDVSVGVNAIEVMRVCIKYNVMYVNTSLENWDIHNPEVLSPNPNTLYKRTLYAQYQNLVKTFGLGRNNTPTMVFDHGMNPGMITHLTKVALEDAYLGKHGGNIKPPFSKKKLQDISRALQLHTIHISEVDTQKSRIPIRKDTFYNTWSPMGLIAEGLDPIQIGFRKKGWMDRKLGSGISPPEGAKNIRFYPIRGVDAVTKSLVITPNGTPTTYKGMLIPHGESNTLSKFFTVGGNRPDVYYVYLPSFPARESIQNLKSQGYMIPKKVHKVLTLPEISEGYDSIGAYLMFGGGASKSAPSGWWTGTILSVADVKKLGIKYAGPTEVQVAISLLACVRWMMKNRRRGILSPEDLPHRTIIGWCKPYMGKFISRKIRALY